MLSVMTSFIDGVNAYLRVLKWGHVSTHTGDGVTVECAVLNNNGVSYE